MYNSNDFELIDKKGRRHLIKKISSILNLICDNNSINKLDSPFFTDMDIRISIFDYLIRIEKYFECSKSIIIGMLIYIDRLDYCANIYINKYSVHRIIIAAYLIAAKFIEDDTFDNDYYAKVAGIPVDELNLLEREILQKINYNLYIDVDLFENYVKNIIK